MKPSTSPLNNLIEIFSAHPNFKKALSVINDNSKSKFCGLQGLALCIFVGLIRSYFNKPILLVLDGQEHLENTFDDFHLINNSIVTFLPSEMPHVKLPFYSDTSASNNFYINKTLDLLNANLNPITIASPESLYLRLPAPDLYKKYKINLSIGLHIKRENLIKKLDEIGYSRNDYVEKRLEYSVRGGIIDVFPGDQQLPVRIEFDEDVIASLRLFDLESQLSVKTLDRVTISPSSDFITDKGANVTIFDHLPESYILISEYPEDSLMPLLPNPLNVQAKLIYLNQIDLPDITFNIHYPRIDSLPNFFKHVDSITKFYDNPNIYLFCGSENQVDRLSRLLSNNINLVLGSLSISVEFPELGYFLYSETEIFKKSKTSYLTKNFLPERIGEPINLSEISPGEFMVHLDYGIGKFVKLDRVNAFGTVKECLILEYANGDRVYVPLDKLHLVHKYKGTEGFAPKLSRLGTGEWEKSKLSSRRSIFQLSEELIKLYALRHQANRPPYPEDTDLQIQLESSFWYEETPDQLKVTNEIKSDLMKDKPMDRLLCGDVGFGKTEVAIRAAFKVVSASKQVAVLAPTTILADQHFAVFSRRLRDFPIKVAMLSRLVCKKKQKEILKQLASGEIDIIIGTHRILSQDVSFKDLGLLIIDEEHRFGVRAKEKLKFLKTSVDVLSLSATPLPRTLYLSLSGIRDLSILRTPPKSRLPILTEILYFDKKFIKESILRELSRGGQVYFIHNDISTLPRITQTFKELLPDIPIAYAHGQMKERELDEIMHGFVEGNISVLFTTSIIESGIDIPNANTIFINMAHRFGLADLYQLRGRVGRGSRQGFAYLIIPHISQLKPEAIRKLETITKYTSLGSGYQLALNDLEIRGIGNIFGTEQSGNIQAIGYNLYMKILQEALEKIKRGEELSFNEALESDQFFTEVLFPFSSFIPENYIESQSMRFYFYQKMSNCRELEELEKVESEIKDIFGKYPPEVNGLFELHRLRILGEKLRLKKISLSQPITLIWHESVFKAFSLENLLSGLKSICQRVGYSYKISGVNTPTLTLFIKRSSNIVQDVKLFLISLIQTVKL